MSEIDDKTIQKVREEVGLRDLHQIDIDNEGTDFSLLVCAPNRIEWMKFLSDLTSTDDIAKKNQAHENLVLAVAKHPTREEIRGFLSKKFGVLTEITDQLGQIVGAGAKVRAKKL